MSNATTTTVYSQETKGGNVSAWTHEADTHAHTHLHTLTLTLTHTHVWGRGRRTLLR